MLADASDNIATESARGIAQPGHGAGSDGPATHRAIVRSNAPSGREERYFAQTDAMYNVTSITNANGQVAERYEYQPFGTFVALEREARAIIIQANYIRVCMNEEYDFDTNNGLDWERQEAWNTWFYDVLGA